MTMTQRKCDILYADSVTVLKHVTIVFIRFSECIEDPQSVNLRPK